MKFKKEEIESARDTLMQYVKDGDTLYFIQEYSSTGMTRYLRVMLASDRNEILHLTHSIAVACGYQLKDRNGSWYIVMHGFGYSASDEIRSAVEYKTGLTGLRDYVI